MPHKIQEIGDESIIYIELISPFQPSDEFPKIHQQLNKIADKIEPPIFRIIDMTESKIDFATVVESLQQDTSNSLGAATDWRFKPLFVGNDTIAKIAANSLSQQQYGGIESRLFTSRDDAIAHSRRELRAIKQKRQSKS